MLTRVVQVEGLGIADRQGKPLLSEITFCLNAGESLALIGYSGAGKSTLARAILGEPGPGRVFQTGSVVCCGCPVRSATAKRRRELRARHCAWLGQDPAAELTPTMTVARLLQELTDQHPTTRAATPLSDWLRAVGLPEDEAFLRCLPHQLSGGQRRRVALVRVLLKRPRLLILDEPFSGLDSEHRERVQRLLVRLQREQRVALLLISHRLAGIDEIASNTLVLHQGRQVEYGPTPSVFAHPQSFILRQLLATEPVTLSAPILRRTPPLLQVDNMTLGYAARTLTPPLSFQLGAGECVALIGASGCGKSSLANAVIGVNPAKTGTLRLRGAVLAPQVTQRQRAQQQALALVPQDPAQSLNPFRRIGTQLTQALTRYHDPPSMSVAHLLSQVGLPATYADRYPAQLSGGEQQRVALARALAGHPQVLICDEVTSALDVVTRRQILQLLKRLCQTREMALLLITHDIAAAKAIGASLLHLSPITGITSSLDDHAGDSADDGYYRPFAVSE